MFNNGTSLRHLPFFEEVAAHEEHQAEWRAATAGLVTLRLVDAWIEEGREVVAPDSFMANAVLKAIDTMDDGSTLPGILRSVVMAMQGASPGDTHEVLPRLIAYGRALEYEAQWLLAIDVYDTVITHAHPIQESDSATAAHQRRGFSLRLLSHFDESLAAYAMASLVAENAGDMVGVLRAKIGAANVAMARGNLPYAEQAFEGIAHEAAELGLSEPQSMALDSRAAVAGFRGDHELAVKFAYQALRVASEPAERDRILNNIGTAFHMLGIRSAARDAFLVLSVTAQEQYIRWTAMLSLMTLAAEDGSELAFEKMREKIPLREMPPDMQIDYFIHLGRAQRALHRDDLAEIAFAKAIEMAERHGLNRQLFEAEREMETGQRQTYTIRTSKKPSDTLVEIASAVHELRLNMVPAST